MRSPLLLLLITLVSCSGDPLKLWVDYDSFPGEERNFLASVLDDGAMHTMGLTASGKPGPETLVIGFEQRIIEWQKSEFESLLNFLPLTRICMVYPAEVWENKELSAEDVLGRDSGMRTSLIPLASLAPPFIAARIGGHDAGSPYYPLVHESGIRFSYNGKHTRKAEKKIYELAWLIREKLPENRNSVGYAGPFRFERRPTLFTIAAGGDLMLARGAEDILFAEGPGGILGGTAELVLESNLSLVNMEGAITGRGEQAEKTYTFRFDPRAAPALKDAGFDAVLVANNHAFDFGVDGFLDTISALETAGLGVLGAGRDIHAAAAPFVFDLIPLYENDTVLPVKIFGLASYGRERGGWDGLDYAAGENKPGLLHAGDGGAELITKQLAKNAFNIVFFHGGIEYGDYPDAATRALYTGLIRGGADLVIGTHPHVEQGFEWVEGKPVFWSLGDYVFNEMDDTPGGDKGLFVVLYYNGRVLVHIDLYPVFMAGPRTVVSPKGQLERFLSLTKELAQK